MMTIKCSNCGGVIPFDEYMKNDNKCPLCRREWNKANIKNNRFRSKD